MADWWVADSAVLNGLTLASEATKASVRQFDSGAVRDLDDSKLDFEGFLSPRVIEAFGEFMHFNRKTAAGMRDSDNWQLGIPMDQYMKSGWRHFFDWWAGHRGVPTSEPVEIAILALMFNAMGYLHERLKENPDAVREALQVMERERNATTERNG